MKGEGKMKQKNSRPVQVSRWVRTGSLAASLFAAFLLPSISMASERLNFDKGWKFALGHAAEAEKDFNFSSGSFSAYGKQGTDAGPIGLGFRDSGWNDVNLPHDWVVTLPFEPKADLMHGYKPVGRAYSQNSVGWYRKSFQVPAEWKENRVRITFDGVYRNAQVWVNGHWLGRNDAGTIGFTHDLSDYLVFGSRNVISVRVDASDFEGWYYEGAGIYRHTWISVSPKVHFTQDGVALRPSVRGKGGVLQVEAEVRNETDKAVRHPLTLSLVDERGVIIGKSSGGSALVPARSTQIVKARLSVPVVEKWGVKSPTLYTAKVGFGQELYEKKIGFRSFKFDADKGFSLNGEPMKIKGFCIHQDHAGVGVAVPDSINEWRLVQLKRLGTNFIRTAHQPATPEVLEACDRLGIMVLSETRLFGAEGEARSTLERLVKRDRNHPSVIFWSIGNEEWGTQHSEESARIASTMMRTLRKHDPTRPATFGSNNGAQVEGLNSVVDIRGLNYGIAYVDPYRKARPDQPFHFSEVASTVTTRGEYTNDPVKAYVAAYDTKKIDWGTSAETWWKMVLEREWLMGGFVWTGFDYRGEPTPYSWPNINSHFGVLDVCGFAKDVSWYYRTWWTDEPVLYIFPHWNHEGKEGQPIDVWAFSNHDEVELFLNGVSQGRRKTEKGGHLEWKVPFQPGELKAVAYRAGAKSQETIVATTGSAVRIKLSADRSQLTADGADAVPITVSVTDAQGRVVPGAANEIRFRVEGAGKVIGVGNGDPSSHEPDQFLSSTKAIETGDWRMKPLVAGETAESILRAKPDFSTWKTDALTANQLSQPGSAAAFWTSFTALGDAEWSSLAVGPIDDKGEIYLNGVLLGTTASWNATHNFDVKGKILLGKNELLVIAKNDGGGGGFQGGVSLAGRTQEPEWSRSVFHGLAQVILQSVEKEGAVIFIAEADGLAPARIRLTSSKKLQANP